jgi:hypothetical protein
MLVAWCEIVSTPYGPPDTDTEHPRLCGILLGSQYLDTLFVPIGYQPLSICTPELLLVSLDRTQEYILSHHFLRPSTLCACH